MVIVVTKNTKNNCFIQVKSPFLVAEVSNTVTFLKKFSFWRDINVTYNNQTWFPSQIYFVMSHLLT